MKDCPVASVTVPKVSPELTPATLMALNCNVAVFSVIGAAALMRLELLNAPAGTLANADALKLSNSKVLLWLTVTLDEVKADPRPTKARRPPEKAPPTAAPLMVVGPAYELELARISVAAMMLSFPTHVLLPLSWTLLVPTTVSPVASLLDTVPLTVSATPVAAR